MPLEGFDIPAVPREGDRTSPPDRNKEEWVYGYRIKNKYYRQFSEKAGLNWRTQSFGVMCLFTDWLERTSGVDFGVREIRYHGQPGLAIVFTEDDPRRRLDNMKAVDADIGKVQKMMGISEGKKPKWYQVEGRNAGTDAEVSSGDEDFPYDENFPIANIRDPYGHLSKEELWFLDDDDDDDDV